ncbi:MAG: hypothetical protein EPN85_07270 [Bacteroidetes bacterium]|nr:MAG: hypothetical protein EPN85_07270 [Bacteroidota bacterium]
MPKIHPVLKKIYGTKIPDFVGYAPFADYKKFENENYTGFKKIRFRIKIYRGYFAAYARLFFTLLFKRCYYGPYKGEFGNFLGHNLPFLTYLYSKGVKIYYCGMLLHQPFLVDEKGNSIIYKYYPLRDFFREVSPGTNSTIPPPDVQLEIDVFEKEAKSSLLPFFNVGDPYYYWFIHRSWMLESFMKIVPLEKVYKTKDERSIVVFPRSKGARSTPNNGESWNWEEVVRTVKPHVDKVYVMGHPAFSVPMESFDNVEVLITDNNALILEKCSNSQLIITQHSGTCYLGEYTNTQVLVIFHGKFPISSINDSIIFKEFIGTRFLLAFAFSMPDIQDYVKKHFSFRVK